MPFEAFFVRDRPFDRFVTDESRLTAAIEDEAEGASCNGDFDRRDDGGFESR